MFLRRALMTAHLTAAALAAPVSAHAMMPPWVYDEAIEQAAGRAVLGDLSVTFDADALQCLVAGTVLRTMAGIGDFPRFDDSRPPPPVPNPGAPLERPAAGETMSVTTPCFAADSTDIPVGGDLYRKLEDLLKAEEVTILVDADGRYHDARSAGFLISKGRPGD